MANLSKNIISKDGPTNDLERLVAKINGDDVNIPAPANGLEYQLNRLSKTYPENADILENAKDLGGIGYVEPDALFYSGRLSTDSPVSFSPAKLILTPGETYTFIVKNLRSGEEETITSDPAELNAMAQIVFIDIDYFSTGTIRISSQISLNENDIRLIPVGPMSFWTDVEIILVGKTHQISQQFLPGVFTVHVDADTNTLDKTMGEIQEAWARGDRIDIISEQDHGGIIHPIHYVPHILEDVYYNAKANNYVGRVWCRNSNDNLVAYTVNEVTEADALNAYPTLA